MYLSDSNQDKNWINLNSEDKGILAFIENVIDPTKKILGTGFITDYIDKKRGSIPGEIGYMMRIFSKIYKKIFITERSKKIPMSYDDIFLSAWNTFKEATGNIRRIYFFADKKYNIDTQNILFSIYRILLKHEIPNNLKEKLLNDFDYLKENIISDSGDGVVIRESRNPKEIKKENEVNQAIDKARSRTDYVKYFEKSFEEPEPVSRKLQQGESSTPHPQLRRHSTIVQRLPYGYR